AANGTVTKNPNKTSYACGESVTLTATPSSGYSFGSWTGDASGTNSSVTMTMNANKTVTANFTQIQTYTLTKTAIPSSGGTITVSPEKTSYTSGETVTLTATPNTCYSFSGWAGDASGTSASTTITMNANKTVTANFTQKTYTLTLTAANGTVTKNPNKTSYACGESVTLTATPNSGYSFGSWTGDATGTISSVTTTMNANISSVTITMNANKNVSVNFIEIPPETYTLNKTASPSDGGTISLSPEKPSYTSGETVILTATPNSGYRFESWSGDASGTNSSVTITMNDHKTVTANFVRVELQTYTLTQTASPSDGGTISVSPDKPSYTSGETVTLTATPNTGFNFINWNGDASGIYPIATLVMNENKTVSAVFAMSVAIQNKIAVNEVIQTEDYIIADPTSVFDFDFLVSLPNNTDNEYRVYALVIYFPVMGEPMYLFRTNNFFNPFVIYTGGTIPVYSTNQGGKAVAVNFYTGTLSDILGHLDFYIGYEPNTDQVFGKDFIYNPKPYVVELK
ncbi:MAG: InlB B-repeat-containing protein, partial [Desulfobacterales bacterium]|nr:InlB B-repeat-containing protein [Desulfobacterales bacterium]